MIIKERVYKTFTKEVKEMISDEVYGCDECGEEIKEYPNETSRLEITVFNREMDSEYLHFCSWKCVLAKLPKISCNYFVSLPFMYFDEGTVSKRSATALLNELNKQP